jgi:hypothetical protein
MLWLQDKTRRSHSPHISCARNGSPSVTVISPTIAFVTTTNYLQHKFSSLPLYLRLHSTPDYLQHWLRSFPLFLRLHTTPDRLPTIMAQFASTFPQTAHYARQTIYNNGSDRSHFSSDCTLRQTDYLQ